ncbi:MAG: ATP-binding protein, partial [Chthoniobacterales bacterium]
MPSLDRVYLINAAGFDEVEFPVSGHCQVIGINGHGKSTLLRTVLFFYLGANEKPLYALDETKSDFVTHYLGNPPSYLIYEVARGDGQPSFHVAVTRPAGRIQFYFVDAPYRRDYFIDDQMVLPIEDVQERWRDAKCAVDPVSSYEDFNHRIYGVISSPYAVFRPAARSAGQDSVLPRIISGIYTVSQLEADKLKSALTCGIRRDGQVAELDLEHLKNQLTHFHRVNRAVKSYLRYEQDALDLVELGESYEVAKAERQRAIEDLVRAAKLLPDEARRVAEQKGNLQKEEDVAEAAHSAESKRLNESIKKLGERIAILKAKIDEAEAIKSEYERLDIAQKAAELESLPAREAEKELADREYASLTAKFANETERKGHVLAGVHQSWAELRERFQQRRLALEHDARKALEQLQSEKEAARTSIDAERTATAVAMLPRRTELESARSALTDDFKALGEIKPPAEIAVTERQLRNAERQQTEEAARQERSRSELELAKQKFATERDKLQREAISQRDRLSEKVERLTTECERIEHELEAFDASLARLFQTTSADGWPHAAKTFNRETLFTSAETLNAQKSGLSGAWGLNFATELLPNAAQSYNRDELTKSLREVRKQLAEKKDEKQAAETRFLTDFDAFEKRAAQIISSLQTRITASAEARGKFGDEALRLENALINLRSRFEDMIRQRRDDLALREKAWKEASGSLRKEEAESETAFRVRLKNLEEDFKSRRAALIRTQEDCRAAIGNDEAEAKRHRDEQVERIERESRERLVGAGADATLLAAAESRAANAEREIQRISNFRDEVAVYQQKKIDFVGRLPAWESERKAAAESLQAQECALQQLSDRYQSARHGFQTRRAQLDKAIHAVSKDEEAVARCQKDPRFVQELGFFDRDDLPPAALYQSGAAREHLDVAENAHQRTEEIAKRGDKHAKAFLNKFDAETLDRKVLGFSPIREYFDWFIFVGSELKPFVVQHRISGLKQTQTHQFDQFIRNICNKNAAFSAGIRQVRRTAESVQAHVAKTNFVDVLDSIELKIDAVDN